MKIEQGGGMKIRDAAGKFKKVKPPKFFSGQFVRTNGTHFSQKELTQVLEPTWTETRGWVYIEAFCHIEDGKIIVSGGRGMWNDEDLYKSLTNSKLKLLAELYHREKEISEIEHRKNILAEEVEKISFTILLLAKQEAKWLTN